MARHATASRSRSVSVVPTGAMPTFRAGALAVTTHLEVRAIVAWGEDVVVRPPLHVVPRASAPRAGARLGGARSAVSAGRSCGSARLSAARSRRMPSAERMYGTRGRIAIEIRTEQRDADFWLVAKLSLGRASASISTSARRNGPTCSRSTS